MLKHKHSHYWLWSLARQETMRLWSSGLQSPAGNMGQGHESEYISNQYVATMSGGSLCRDMTKYRKTHAHIHAQSKMCACTYMSPHRV